MDKLKLIGFLWIENNIINKHTTYTKPGSISYLLYGKRQSVQSINIKLGYFGEYIIKELIKLNNIFTLLDCGIYNINNKKKDIDILFADNYRKIIYYRELKGNIELDTEKIEATINKCNEIKESLQNTYTGYIVNFAILNWSVYDRQILSAGLNNIRKFEHNNIKIDHMEDLLNILNIIWDEKDFYSYFVDIGDKIQNNTNF